MDDYHDSSQFSWHLKILIEAEFYGGQVSDKANELAVDWNRTLLRIG